MQEEWKAVVGYEGLYEVSSFGRVRRSAGVDQLGREVPPCILKWRLDRNGYPKIALHKDGAGRGYFIHDLVLTAFIGPRPAGHLGCHGDADRTFNHISNLRWDTHQENMEDMKRHGNSARGSRNAFSKLKEEDIPIIRQKVANGEVYEKIAEQYGVKRCVIKDIVRGRSWSHVPEDTEYTDEQRKLNEKRKRTGENNGTSLLTEADVIIIRKLLKDKVSGSVIARAYQLSTPTVSAIKTRYNWAHIPEDAEPDPAEYAAVLEKLRAIPNKPGRATITEQQVREVKRLIAENTSLKDLAAQFNVDVDTVRNIANGKTWSHVAG